MKIDSELITKWSVNFTNIFYDFVVRNFYFFLSNIILFLCLLVFKVNMNNLIIFIFPIFLHVNSYSIQFDLINCSSTNRYRWKDYLRFVKKSIISNWKAHSVMTLLLVILIINIAIVISVSEINFMLIPILITGSFMINSFYYYLELYLNNPNKKNSISSSLILSYGNIPTFLKNTLLLIVELFLVFYISPIVILVSGDLISRIILKNIK